MKFLALLAVLPVAISALTQFGSKNELLKCKQKCEEFVRPCLKDHQSQCFKVYHKCIEHKQPFSCLSSVNSITISKIVQCFDQKCDSASLDREDQEDQKETSQFEKVINRGQVEATPIIPMPESSPKTVDIPILIKGHVVRFDENGEPINEVVPMSSPKKARFGVESEKKKDEEQQIKEPAS